MSKWGVRFAQGWRSSPVTDRDGWASDGEAGRVAGAACRAAEACRHVTPLLRALACERNAPTDGATCISNETPAHILAVDMLCVGAISVVEGVSRER